MPDPASGGCETGCGTGTPLDNVYSASSHELVEATTDADVGDGTLAWYDDNFGEIADICAFFRPAKERGFTVQAEDGGVVRPSLGAAYARGRPVRGTACRGHCFGFVIGLSSIS